MNMQMQLQYNHGVFVETSWLEEVLFKIGDICNIRIVIEPAVTSTVAAVVGGLLGALVGGRTGAIFGAGIAGAVGYGAATEMTLREAWQKKNKLSGILDIILEFLRSLDYFDYISAAEILYASIQCREEVCEKIIQYIVAKLGQAAYRTPSLKQ